VVSEMVMLGSGTGSGSAAGGPAEGGFKSSPPRGGSNRGGNAPDTGPISDPDDDLPF